MKIQGEVQRRVWKKGKQEEMMSYNIKKIKEKQLKNMDLQIYKVVFLFKLFYY